jgi:hypothetical protein
VEKETVFLEIGQSVVAAEAQNASDLPCGMVVVHVKRDVVTGWPTTDETTAALGLQHGVVLLNRDAELALQVTGAGAELGLGRAPHAPLVGLEPLKVLLPPLPGSGDVRLTDQRISRLGPRPEAGLAVASESIPGARRPVERFKRLRHSAFDAFLHAAILGEHLFAVKILFHICT